MKTDELGQYYMSLHYKADYNGHYDESGIPMLNYQGHIGLQYNPIAIAQYGLGNYNLWCYTHEESRYQKFITAADWLVDNLGKNRHGLSVWMHHFDFEYRDTLCDPWYSGLAQGQGLSVLVRAHKETGDMRYLSAATSAFEPFKKEVDQGGVIYSDENGNKWIEEYIVDPPTHILNGFIWASWGLYDYWLYTGNQEALLIFELSVKTLEENLIKYDTWYWSIYEQSGKRIKMLASPFYHQLHIVQLKVMYTLTGKSLFNTYAEKWASYSNSKFNKYFAYTHKALFKLMYY